MRNLVAVFVLGLGVITAGGALAAPAQHEDRDKIAHVKSSPGGTVPESTDAA